MVNCEECMNFAYDEEYEEYLCGMDMDEDEIRRSGLAAAFPIGPRPQTESDLKNAMRPEVASVNITETVAKALESLSPSLFRENL